MNLNFIKNQEGLVALTTVLIILIITLTIGISLSLRSIIGAKMSLQKVQSLEAYYLANLCAEQALMNLKENVNYPGGESFNIQEGHCIILPVEGRWTIKVSANSSNHVRKMKITISEVNPKIIINSWEEVADF